MAAGDGLRSVRRAVGAESGKLTRPPLAPAYRRVAAQIRDLVDRGELKPGDQLAAERKLAEMMGASRSAVREALVELSGSGLLELTAQGAVVRQPDVRGLAGAFRSLVGSTYTSVIELLESREIIESQAVKLAAERCTDVDLHRLRVLASQVQDAVEQGKDAADADTDFHLQMVACAQNRILSQVVGVLDDAMRHLYGPIRSRMLADPGMAERFVQEHWEIVDCLQGRRPDKACAIVLGHIQRAKEFVCMAAEGDRGRT